MRHIVIVTHEHDEFAKTNYIMRGICQAWVESGLKVTALRGLGKRVDADLAVLHVDLTVVPREYLEFMRQYPAAINAAVADISKRRISRNLVRRGDGYDGPVIVKTNLNFGGGREGEVAQKTSLLRKYVRAVRRRLPWSWRAEIGVWDYPIFDSVAQVPWAVWHNRDLVVERFLPERRDGLYCMRSWLFLGEAETNTLMYANQPIIKSRVAVRKEPAEVPDELRQMRRDLGFDYGKFDYGIVDGRVVLYDANRTPVVGDPALYEPLFKVLAPGIEAFGNERTKIVNAMAGT
ncbi:MAG: hypothetical protein ABSB33_14095 [Tepidisphaeraceae bacterium]|jgi:hypothetical protein